MKEVMAPPHRTPLLCCTLAGPAATCANPAKTHILVQADTQFCRAHSSLNEVLKIHSQHMPSTQICAHQAQWPIAGSQAWRGPLRRQGEWPTLASCLHE